MTLAPPNTDRSVVSIPADAVKTGLTKYRTDTLLELLLRRPCLFISTEPGWNKIAGVHAKIHRAFVSLEHRRIEDDFRWRSSRSNLTQC